MRPPGVFSCRIPTVTGIAADAAATPVRCPGNSDTIRNPSDCTGYSVRGHFLNNSLFCFNKYHKKTEMYNIKSSLFTAFFSVTHSSGIVQRRKSSERCSPGQGMHPNREDRSGINGFTAVEGKDKLFRAHSGLLRLTV